MNIDDLPWFICVDENGYRICIQSTSAREAERIARECYNMKKPKATQI